MNLGKGVRNSLIVLLVFFISIVSFSLFTPFKTAFQAVKGQFQSQTGDLPSSKTPLLIRNFEYPFRPLEGPFIVAVQPGHWEVHALPDELRRLRNSTGAEHEGLREVDINLQVARALLELMAAEGWKGVLVPATVPPGLRVDAFISIHADYGNDPSLEGWKLSSPFRSSTASRDLAKALEQAFARMGVEQDWVRMARSLDAGNFVNPPPKSPTPPTVNMRGYFGFNYRRFEHSISPYTPAVLIELGYLTNPNDRTRLTQTPELYARTIISGLKTYFQHYHHRNESYLTPPHYPWVSVGPESTMVYQFPTRESSRLWVLEPGTVLLPVDEKGEWYEVFVRAKFSTGWVLKQATQPATDPRWPMPGEGPNPPVSNGGNSSQSYSHPN